MEKLSDVPEEEIDKLIKIYTSFEYVEDGHKIWFSRLKENDTRRNTEYEIEYGYWIPENPLNALVWVILLGSFTQQEIDELHEQVKSPDTLKRLPLKTDSQLI
ncbi:MAG TPA: hypothetical protein VFC67_20045 [Prolixibacteraceae bacterium]|nr:hypothetical protein [Prolixibacteraceae bacterium]